MAIRTLKFCFYIVLCSTIEMWNANFVVIATVYSNGSDFKSTFPVSAGLDSKVNETGRVVQTNERSIELSSERSLDNYAPTKPQRTRWAPKQNTDKEALGPISEGFLVGRHMQRGSPDLDVAGDGSGEVDISDNDTSATSEFPTTVTWTTDITRSLLTERSGNGATTDFEISAGSKVSSVSTERSDTSGTNELHPDVTHLTTELTTLRHDTMELPPTTQIGSMAWTAPSCPEQLERLFFPDRFLTDNGIMAKWTFRCYVRNMMFNVTYSVVGKENDSHALQTYAKNVTILGLRAFTTYDVCVCALVDTRTDSCYVTCGKVTTRVGRPDRPENVTVTDVTANSMTVKWEPPVRYAGPTHYTINLVGSTNVSHSVEEDVYVATVSNLVPFTNYCLSVEAETEVGVNSSLGTRCYRTRPGVPSEVQNVHGSCKVVECNLFWTIPDVVNGYLDNYKLSYFGFRSFSKGHHNGSREVNDSTGTAVEFLVQGLMANSVYTFMVRAKTKGVSELGKPSYFRVNTHAGVPKFTHSTAHVFTDTSLNARSQVKISMTRDLFSDEFGDILQYALIIAQASKAEGRQRGLKDSGYFFTWSQVKNEDKILPYVTTPHDWNPFCEYGNFICNSIIYVIGNDSNCFQYSNLLERCNGPLRPGTTYSAKIRAYTSGGYVDSPLVNFETESSNATVAICVFCLLLFKLLVITGALWLKRKNIAFQCVNLKKCGKVENSVSSVDVIPIKATAKPILLSNFCNHFEVMSSDSGLKFSKEFEELNEVSPSAASNVAQLPENKAKNRWINILPFDESRVKLLPIPDDVSTDYINASYIPGYRSPREYIATQGPLATTKDDFWRMVWEQSSPMIVMVTQCVERGKVKCEEYWPSDQQKHYYGDLAVRLKSESILSGFTMRIFDLELGTRLVEVKQMHFTIWPDFGCPANTTLLLDFVRTVRDHIPRGYNGPIIVHCSAGVGRTGTFIAVDHLMQHVVSYDFVDVYGLVHNMRQYRTNMVQTEDQYVYIHECIRDLLHEQHSL